MSNLLYPQTLPDRTSQLLLVIKESNTTFLNSFYLSGGTALSLQLGHRESEDLDFFSETTFDPRRLQAEIERLGQLDDLELSENTLNCYMNGVKLQCLGYPYPLLEATTNYESIKLSSVVDIACTKLQTIGMRGSKKDFIDMYVLLQKYTLTELINKMSEKYKDSEFNIPHLLKSLVYFVDAEDQVMPRLHADIDWDEVKIKMIDLVKEFKLS